MTVSDAKTEINTIRETTEALDAFYENHKKLRNEMDFVEVTKLLLKNYEWILEHAIDNAEIKIQGVYAIIQADKELVRNISKYL